MVIVFVPIASMLAPIATRNLARSCTCGSLAALRNTVVPAAATAAMRAFSVAVTLGSSRKMSAPRSVFASSWYVAPTVISAPSRSSARKWVSTPRRPITSPPGGGRFTRPNRASIGPASRMDARIRAESLGSGSRGSAAAVFTSTELGAVHATAAPKWASSSSMVSTSRMWGTLSMRQGPSASRVAARMGSAAFLFPAGRIVPLSGRPPETRNDGGIGDRKLRRGLRARQACANVRPCESGSRARAPRRRRAPRLPTVLGLAAVAAASGPGAVTAVARAVGVAPRLARALSRAAALETAAAALAMGVPLALRHPVAWTVFAVSGGALVGWVCSSVTRRALAGRDLTAPLVGSGLLGAGVGYATDVSPFIVCALAGLVTVNASPRRRELRTTLRAWERPMYAPVLIISGALLALPTVWIIAAVPALQALRIAARWVSTRYARLALPLRDLTPHFGLGTVAQGGTALALAVNYFITYGSGPESPGGGASGMDAGAAVLTTMVLGVALAQLAAPPLMRLAVRAGPAPLPPPPGRPELTANAPVD